MPEVYGNDGVVLGNMLGDVVYDKSGNKVYLISEGEVYSISDDRDSSIYKTIPWIMIGNISDGIAKSSDGNILFRVINK